MSEYTHYAFSDDSKQDDFYGLSIVSLKREDYETLKTQVEEKLIESGKKEYKWKETNGGRAYQKLAEEIIEFVFNNHDKILITTLIYSDKDYRNDIRGRLDTDNKIRMYYHLLAHVTTKSYSGFVRDNKWLWRPDKDNALRDDWDTLEECITSKVHQMQKEITKEMLIDHLLGRDKMEFKPELFAQVQLDLEPSDSRGNVFIQIADFFAGIAAYSYKNYPDYRQWSKRAQGKFQFSDQTNSKNITKSQESRFLLIERLHDKCKERTLQISLSQEKGFNSNKRQFLNFWRYKSQTVRDKAPTRDRL